MAAPRQEVLRIPGRAFETTPEGVLKLFVRTRRTEPLTAGDLLPPIQGKFYDRERQSVQDYDVGDIKGIVILSILNACETPVCDKQMVKMNEFAQQNPDITIVTLTKQPWDEELIATAKSLKGKHVIVSIDDETAADLGVGLEPTAGVSDEYYDYLFRKVLVRNSMNGIVYGQDVDDQNEEPDYDPLFKAAADAYQQYMNPF